MPPNRTNGAYWVPCGLLWKNYGKTDVVTANLYSWKCQHLSAFSTVHFGVSRRFTTLKAFSLYRFCSHSAQQLGALTHKVKGRGKQFMVCSLFQ